MKPPRQKVTVAAPCRADLAGGTLDIWPLGLLHPGSLTVNMAIPVEVELSVERWNGGAGVELVRVDGEVRRLEPADAMSDLTAGVVFALVPAGGIRVRVAAQAPLRSGIGGSSAYGIALARALSVLDGLDVPDDRAVALVRDLEARVITAPTGEQDHWAAVRGGVLALHCEAGGNRIELLVIDPDWLADRVTVYYSGVRHHSGMVNWKVIRRRLDGHRETREAFSEISAAAVACRDRLLALDEDGVAEAIRCEWKARRRLAPEVSTPELDELVRIARENGASAVKGCGAGGGGSVLIWHPSGTRTMIVDALDKQSNGGRTIAFGSAAKGCRVLEPTPES